MSNHTPGPWKAHKPGDLGPMQHDWDITGGVAPDPVTNARYLFVAKVLKTAHPNPMWRQDEENEANARLIASAPDLLEALEAVKAALSQNATYPADLDFVRNVTERAIRKAKGDR